MYTSFSSQKLKTSEIWELSNSLFSVEIVRWEMPDFAVMEWNVWNVYVKFFPDFPNFEMFIDSYEKFDSFNLPFKFHCGATFSFFTYNSEGEYLSKKFGCDYMHFGDDTIKKAKTKEEAIQVFKDAQKIHDSLVGYVLNLLLDDKKASFEIEVRG
jgi:uncharacterized protein Usg